jgi:hypothetical protein
MCIYMLISIHRLVYNLNMYLNIYCLSIIIRYSHIYVYIYICIIFKYRYVCMYIYIVVFIHTYIDMLYVERYNAVSKCLNFWSILVIM